MHTMLPSERVAIVRTLWPAQTPVTSDPGCVSDDSTTTSMSPQSGPQAPSSTSAGTAHVAIRHMPRAIARRVPPDATTCAGADANDLAMLPDRADAMKRPRRRRATTAVPVSYTHL